MKKQILLPLIAVITIIGIVLAGSAFTTEKQSEETTPTFFRFKSLYDELKNTKIKIKRTKKTFDFLPVFMSGELVQSGGAVKKNMHIKLDGDDKLVIVGCTKEQSSGARSFLEGQIYLSA